MSKRFLSGINVIGGTTLNGVTDAGVDTDKFIVLDSNGVIRYRTGDEILSDVGAVSTARTLSINGTSYDLSADRSWTISTSSSARSIQKFVATANQTTFTITGGYTIGLVDVYVNGVKLDNSGDFTATNGSTIVLTTGTLVNNIVEVYKYINAFTANNALRVSTYFTATAGQTTFAATYSLGLIDVFYNGSKLATSEYNASSGTSIVFNNACSVNDIIEIIAYNYSVGGFTGVSQTRTITINGTAYDLSADRAWTIDNASLGAQPQLNGTGLVRMAGTTVSYDNATYATQSYVTTAVANLVNSAPSTLDTLNELATALGNDANFATTITTSIGTKQPQLNGTGFVKISGTTISYDNSTYYLASNPSAFIALTALSAVGGSGAYNSTTGVITIPTDNNQIANSAGYITSGALSSYLPLAGGTLTGALSGTSASFSSSVTAGTQFLGSSNTTDPTNSTTLATVFSLNGNSSVNPYGIGLAASRNSAFDMFFQTGSSNGGGYRWYIGTSEKMTMFNTGSVSIGSPNAGYKLFVSTTSTGAFNLNAVNCTVGAPMADFYDTGRSQETVITSTDGTTIGTYIASYSNHPLMFGANAGASPTAKMTLTSGGALAIGTSSVAYSNYKFQARVASDRNLAIGVQGTDVSIEAYNDAVSANVPLRIYGTNISLIGGAVLKPNNPAFRVSYSVNSYWNLNFNDVFIFDTVEYNVGSCYNTSNGRFTAPVAGVYQFNFYSIIYGAVTNGAVNLRKNGGYPASGYNIHFTPTQSGAWSNVVYTTSLYLNAGDYVYLTNGGPYTQFHGDDWSSFSGYLVG